MDSPIAKDEKPIITLTHEDGNRLTAVVVSHVGDGLGFGSERKDVLASEFEVANMDYGSLLNKTIRRSWRFFIAVILFQLFAVLPRHTEVPMADTSTLAALPTPPWASWLSLPLATEFALDQALRTAYINLNGTASICVQGHFPGLQR